MFEAQPSVWHREILDALDAGVPVLGGASMGALRAAELCGLGMRGAGRIFRWYRDGIVIDDAEVALLHAGAEHAWRALTVPQVNVRWSAQRSLPPRAAERMIEASSRIFYQERTERAVRDLVPFHLRDRFRLIDLKAEDAREVLRAARAAPARPVRPREPAPSSLVRRRRLLAATPAAGSLESVRAGLRRALLAGWARELGLRPGPREIERARAQIVGNAEPDDVERLAEEIALEGLVLAHAPRMLNDGPSPEEALAAELRIRGPRRD